MLGPDNIASADYGIATKPTYGGEFTVFISREQHTEPGVFEIKAANSGVLTKNASEETALSATPQELVAVLENSVFAGSSDITLTVNGTDENSQAVTGTATFKVPGYAKVATRNFPVGFAVDVKTTGDKKFKTITGVTVSCAADAKSAKITLFGVPSLSSFVQVGCKMDMDFTTKSRVPRPIPCGMDGSAFTKLGRSEPGEINITTKHVSFADGLARYDGVRCTVLGKVIKEDKIATDHLLFLGSIMKARPSFPDGEGEATYGSSGNYEDLALLPAMTA